MGIKVVTPVSVEPVTLAEAKQHLRIDGSDEDSTVARCVSAAREEAEHLLERCVAPQTLQLILDDFPADAILLPRPPITSIESVTYVDPDGVTRTLAGSEYSLDDAGIDAWLLPAVDAEWPETREQANAVTIQYQAGWVAASCPATIKAWILLRAGALYRHRESDSERPPMSAQFVDRLMDRFRIPSV